MPVHILGKRNKVGVIDMSRLLIISGNIHHIITSELGDHFLIFNEWAQQTLTEEEYQATLQMGFFQTELGESYNKRWKQEQKINSVSVYENNVLVSSAGIGPGYMHEWGPNTYK